MKRPVNKALLSLGLSLTRCVEPSRTRQLIRSLRPLDCGIELVRIGGEGDGGYLVPDDLAGIEACFSPGVSTIADFELELASRGITCFLADGSVDSSPVEHERLVFEKKFLGSRDSQDFTSLEAWKDRHLRASTGDLLLQMDIEGGEIEVILNASDRLLAQFRILVIEFHALDLLLTNRFAFQVYEACFGKLLDQFHVAHIHPNNCCGSLTVGKIEVPRVMEFSFIRKDRVSSTQPVRAMPHPLDRDNVPSKPPIALPRCWWA